MNDTPTLNRSDRAIHQIVAADTVAGATVVELHGDIDLAVVEPLRDCMISGIEQDCDVLVDLADVTLIDCASLGALVQAGQLAERRGRKLCLVAPPPVVRWTLAAAGLAAAFPTFGERQLALRASLRDSYVAVGDR